MSWIALLSIVLAVTAVAALSGLTPKGGRPAAGTRLMGVARVILVVVVAGLVTLTLW